LYHNRLIKHISDIRTGTGTYEGAKHFINNKCLKNNKDSSQTLAEARYSKHCITCLITFKLNLFFIIRFDNFQSKPIIACGKLSDTERSNFYLIKLKLYNSNLY
jgi:hypothetical protein